MNSNELKQLIKQAKSIGINTIGELYSLALKYGFLGNKTKLLNYINACFVYQKIL